MKNQNNIRAKTNMKFYENSNGLFTSRQEIEKEKPNTIRSSMYDSNRISLKKTENPINKKIIIPSLERAKALPEVQ